jgi:hypothetical protein
METILEELNMSLLLDKLKSRNVTVRTFQFLLKPQGSLLSISNLRNLVMHDCGLTSG